MWAALGVLALLATLLTPLSTAGAQSLTAPGQADLTAKPGDKSVTLSFSANDNGSPITRWEFRSSTTDGLDADDAWFTVPGGPTASSLTVTTVTDGGTPLRNGTAYEFQVRAINSQGAGTAGEADAHPVHRSGRAHQSCAVYGRHRDTELAASTELDGAHQCRYRQWG